MSSENSTVLSLFENVNKQFDFASQSEILVTFQKINNLQGSVSMPSQWPHTAEPILCGV